MEIVIFKSITNLIPNCILCQFARNLTKTKINEKMCVFLLSGSKNEKKEMSNL